jgi:hypothetical protein
MYLRKVAVSSTNFTGHDVMMDILNRSRRPGRTRVRELPRMKQHVFHLVHALLLREGVFHICRHPEAG